MRHAQLTQRKMCKSMLTLLVLANFFISDYRKRFLFKRSGWAFCIFALSCKQWRWQQVSFPTFLGSCHFPKNVSPLWTITDNENDNETRGISWQNVLRWWMAQMRKDSWDDSLPVNIITCLLWSFRCYADSFAALHCFSQSRFISGTAAPAGPVWRSLS